MISLEDRPSRLCDRVNRREWLRLGGLSTLGLSLPTLLRADETKGPPPNPSSPFTRGLQGTTYGRARSIIFLWLQGGPPQHETFDPKPDAPEGIRGEFKPIATNVPGVRFCELLPRISCHADKLAVVRSVHTNDDNHDVSGYWVLTGYPYGPGSARQIKPTDWPYFGSLVKMLKPSERLPALTSVWIPDVMRLNEGVMPAGQTAGFLGKGWEPERFIGDPAAADYHIEGLSLGGEMTRLRVDRRRDLLSQLDRTLRTAERGGALETWDRLSRHAFDLVTSGKARAAFDLRQEPENVRDRYGRHSWGQSVLLARRLVEAGVRLVHVNWAREGGDSAVDNPMWDTHALNADRLQDCLCPQFDVSFSALLEDLNQRGLLKETLVVAVGEFGRTPRINRLAGRDHWGNVFSCVFAGAGIAGGQVYGTSDRNGAFPSADPVRPHDLTATIFHLLGIDPAGVFYDKSDRPNHLTRGEPLARLLGDSPATLERCPSGGDTTLVPPYDPTPLLDTDFTSGRLHPPSPLSRAKGWRSAAPDGVRLRIDRGATGSFVTLSSTGREIPAHGRVVLAQEVRHARGGQFTFRVRVSGNGSSADEFERAFLTHFTCRLVLFRFANDKKDPRQIQELASASFRPEFGDANARVFLVDRFLGSTQPNVNFPIGNGLGVAIMVEAPSTATTLPVGDWLRIHSATLQFSPRQRDDSVVT